MLSCLADRVKEINNYDKLAATFMNFHSCHGMIWYLRIIEIDAVQMKGY